MNLTDFEQTPIHRVFEMVKREAERYGASLAGSEIIGLIPRRALDMTADYYLQVENFSPALVLENRLEESLQSVGEARPVKLAAAIEPFLSAVAAPSPTPGGGSVAALAGALGASLGQMVAGLSLRKKAPPAQVAALDALLNEFRVARNTLAAAVDRDADSFAAVLKAQKLPRETPGEQGARDVAIQKALMGAVEVPLEIARRSADIFEKLGQLEGMSSPSMLSDVRVGRLMAAAAIRGAIENVEINLEAISDAAFAARAQSEARAIAARLSEAPVSAVR